MSGARTVLVKFKGDATGVVAASKQGTTAMDKFGSGVNAASLVVVGAAAGIAAGLVAIGDEFDNAYDRIRVDTGKTGAELANLEQSFRNVAGNVPATFDEVSAAVAGVSKATGAQGKDLETLATQYLDLARITGTDVTAGLQAGTDALKAWGVPADKMSAGLDNIFRASQLGGGSVEKITGQLQQFAPALRNAGFDLSQSTALLGNLNKVGAPTEKIMGALTVGAGKLAKEGKNSAKGVQELLDKIAAAPNATKAAEIAVAGFGTKAGPTLADAVRKGQLSTEDFAKALGASKDTISGVASETDDWKESLQTLKNNAFLALEPVATKFFNYLNDTAVPALKSVFTWIQNNEGTVKTLGIALAAIGATILAVNIGLKAYEGVMIAIKVATVVWTAVQWLLNAAMTANPIGLVVLAVVALIAIGILLWKNWDTVVHALGVAWNWLWDKLVAIGRWFKEVFYEKLIKGAINSTLTTFGKLWDFVKALPGKIADAFKSLANIITAPFRFAFNKIADLWNNTIGQLSFTVPSWVPLIGGKSFSLPKIPHIEAFEAGGIARGRQPALVGEDGPEIFFPGRTGRVANNKETNGLLAGGDTYVMVKIGDETVRAIVTSERRKADAATARWVRASHAGVAA